MIYIITYKNVIEFRVWILSFRTIVAFNEVHYCSKGFAMNNLILKIEEATGCDNLNDLAIDIAQGVALTGIGIVLLAWLVRLV